MKILTRNKKEYDVITEIIEQNKEKLKNIFVDLNKPEDSIGDIVWSIDDVRNYFPEGTPDETIEDGLLKVEKTLKADMTSIGWDTLEVLKDVITEDIEDEDEEYDDEEEYI